MRKLATAFSAAMAMVMLAFGSAAQAQGSDVAGGEVRAPSPRIMDPDRPGYFQIGAGPSFAVGLDADHALYNINLAYNHNFSDRFTGKVITDLNLGAAADSSRFINLAVGGDYYLNQVRMRYGIPYITADLGAGFARDDEDKTKTGAALGAGTGFKFAAQSLNFDVNLHYTLLTAQIDGSNPSIFGVRLAVNF